MQAEACDIVVAQDDSMVMWLHELNHLVELIPTIRLYYIPHGKLYLMNIIMLAGTVQKL